MRLFACQHARFPHAGYTVMHVISDVLKAVFSYYINFTVNAICFNYPEKGPTFCTYFGTCMCAVNILLHILYHLIIGFKDCIEIQNYVLEYEDFIINPMSFVSYRNHIENKKRHQCNFSPSEGQLQKIWSMDTIKAILIKTTNGDIMVKMRTN